MQECSCAIDMISPGAHRSVEAGDALEDAKDLDCEQRAVPLYRTHRSKSYIRGLDWI